MSIEPKIVSDILRHCERTRSNEARVALERLFWKPLQNLQIELEPSCPLSGHKDVLSTQLAAKVELQNSIWMCKLCGKMFRSEHYLDKHLARKHAMVIDDTSASICFADLCDSVVPCVPLTKEPLPYVSTDLLLRLEKEDNVEEGSHVIDDTCNNEQMRIRRKSACVHVIEKCIHKSFRYKLSPRLFAKLVANFERDLCHKAAISGCIHRNEIFDQLGSSEKYLRSSININSFTKGWWSSSLGLLFIPLVILISLIVFRRRNRTIVKSEKVS